MAAVFRVLNEETRQPVENPVAGVLARGRVVGLANHTLLVARDGAERPVDDAAAPIRDAAGDCHLVLIRVVASYNPWLGVRFSTYAFTCLLRAVTRLARRLTADRLTRSVRLESLPGGWLRARIGEARPGASPREVEEYFHDGHHLLTAREKKVLTRRFGLGGGDEAWTLRQVGREVGLSKERVRQIQTGALGKLRAALYE